MMNGCYPRTCYRQNTTLEIWYHEGAVFLPTVCALQESGVHELWLWLVRMLEQKPNKRGEGFEQLDIPPAIVLAIHNRPMTGGEQNPWFSRWHTCQAWNSVNSACIVTWFSNMSYDNVCRLFDEINDWKGSFHNWKATGRCCLEYLQNTSSR